MINSPSLDLVEYVETKILPLYANFDKAHNLSHVLDVIKASLELVRVTGADINMVYAVAAYHDLGLCGPRAIHHITGGKILVSDKNLTKWFSKSQIEIMKKAIEDHRASASHAPRSIYGKIVAEADRDLTPDKVFRRAVQFGLSIYPEKNKDEQMKRFLNHIEEKYSINGYMKIWIVGSSNEKKLNELRTIISNTAKMKIIFNKLYEEETASL